MASAVNHPDFPMKRLLPACLLLPALLCISSCTLRDAASDRRALQFPPGRPLDAGPKAHRNRAVSARLKVGVTRIEGPAKAVEPERFLAEPPKQKKRRKTPKFRQVPDWPAPAKQRSTKGLAGNTFDALDYDSNADNTGGFVFIPADPVLAAGPSHVVAVTNTSIAIYDKSGTELDSESLQDFFSPLSPPTFTFDPKILFDQFENRFLVLTLERQDIDEGDSSNTSRILLAVSDTDDPTGSWTVTEINGFETIGFQDHWVDFPGFAVDEEAVYITVNLFQFFNQANGGAFGGTRLFIVEKDVNNGFYDGRSADVMRFNPFTFPGTFAGTHQPAHLFGTPPLGNTGTWLVLQSGLFNGSNEEAQVVQVNSPTGNTSFNFEFVSLGNIDNNPNTPLGNLPQSGSNLDPDAGDRRVLDAVWRDNSLYFTATTRARTGPDSGETTAYWAEVNTQTDNLVQLGMLGGEDIANNTETAYAAIAVNEVGVIALGFTSANENSFLSSHYALHFPGDAAGSNRGSELLRAGTDIFELTFVPDQDPPPDPPPEVRWGDYSSVALDPNSECFWVYNKHAISRGSPTGGEIGRWGTAAAEVCSNQPPTPVADALTVAEGGSVDRTDGNENSLLDNDSDPDSDNLDINRTPTTDPGVGSVSIAANGTFDYTHDGSDSSNDLFRYEVCDDGSPVLCAEAQVNVTITEVNDPPVANNDIGPTISEDDDETISISGLLANDSVGDIGTGQTLDITAVDEEINGTADLLSSSIRFTPADDFFGTASFRYTATDDGTNDGDSNPLSDTAIVTITVSEVNDPPVVTGETIANLAEDGIYTVPFSVLLANDLPGPTNEAGQQLSINLAANPAGGSVMLDGGNVVFTAAPDFNGSAGFDYRVLDNGTTAGNANPLTDVTRAQFMVIEVNDPPQPAADVLPDVLEDSAGFTLDASVLLVNDAPGPANESGQALTLIDVRDPVGGTVSLDGITITFTPAPQFSGVAGFSYTAEDDGTSGGQPDPLSAAGTVTFNVVGDNDPPSATDDSLTVVRGRESVILDDGSVRLTDNDSDPEQATLSVSATPMTAPSQGTVTLAADGSFRYEHSAANLAGDNFRYEVCDEGQPVLCTSAQVTVTVIESPFARCSAGGSRVVVGIPVGLPAADLFDSPRGNFAAQGLPASLTIDPGNGVISGTPAAGDLPNSPYFVTVTSAGAPRFFSLRVDGDTDSLFFSGLEDECL